jgi:AcrR family transcriptional regulator
LPESARREQILNAALAVARRDGLAAVTARSVADEAGMSQGLVFFHFGSTEALLSALVAHVSEETLTTGPTPVDFAKLPGTGQLGAFLGARLEHLATLGDCRVVDLLVEAWVVGLQAPATRKSVRAAAAKYRETFLPMARAAIAAEPERFADVTADSLATLVLSLVLGTAIQGAVDPSTWETHTLGAAVRALLSPVRTEGPKPTPRARRPR